MIALLILLLAASGLNAYADECEEPDNIANAAQAEYVQSRTGADRLLSALATVRECYTPEDFRWHWATVTEADVLMREGLLDDSRERINAYLSSQTGAFALWTARAYVVQGRLNSREGRSFAYLESLLDAVEWMDELSPQWQFDLYVDLSYAYSSIGALEQADRIYTEALTLFEERVPRLKYLDLMLRRAVDRSELFRLNHLSDSLTIHNNLAEAIQVVDEMEELLQDTGSPATMVQHQILSSAHSYMYELYRQASDPVRALESARRALDWVHESATWQRALVYRRLGWAHLEVGEPDEALDYFERARPLFAVHLSGISDVYFGIATVYINQGRTEEAEVVLREVIAMQEGPINLSSWGVLMTDRGLSLQRALVSVLLEQGRFEEAYLALENTFGRRIRDAQNVVHYQRESEEFRQAYSRLQERLRDARYQVYLNPDNPSTLANLRQVEGEVAGLIPVPNSPPQPSVRDIQTRLQHDNRVLLTYFLDEPAHVFVLRADTFATVPLPVNQDSLWAQVRRIGLEETYGGASTYIEAEPLQKLYEYVFAPVEYLVPEGVPVTVIADGVLAEVPFPMLVAGDAPRFQYHAWPFLVHRNPFSLEVAGSMIGQTPGNAGNLRVVIMGRSLFGPADGSFFSSATPPPLPHVPDELGSVYRHIGADALLVDEQATRRELLRNIQSAGVLHVASHVQVASDPSFTSILMASDSPETSGAVYLQDLLGLEIPAQLVVLSACESMQGSYRRGDGLMGLHYAFRSAGTDATLATLWPVDDAVMAILMDVFYAELAVGVPKDVALQRAQQHLLASRERLEASPFLWAGLVLSGDPSPVVIEIKTRNSMWILTFFAGMLVGAGIWYYRRRFPAR